MPWPDGGIRTGELMSIGIHQCWRWGTSATSVLLCRSLLAVILLVLAPATAWAQSVPLPLEKPGAAGEDEAGEEAGEEEDGAPSLSCLRALLEAGVVAGPAESSASPGQCTVAEPVAVEAVATSTGTLRLPARPILDCRFVGVLAAWLSEVVNPIAASLLGSPVDAVITGPGHQCRNRAGGRLSEHAIGHAIDVSGVRLLDGRSIGIDGLVGGEGAEREFLRAISTSACGYFTTVLGPGSDAAHADHLHVDSAERSTAEFRICMPR